MEQAEPDLSVTAEERETVYLDAAFAPLVPKFLANRKQEIVAIQEALAAQDFEAVRKIAHGMKGAGGSYGFDALTAMAAAIESAAKQRAAQTIDGQLSALRSYLGRVHVIYEDEASGPGDAGAPVQQAQTEMRGTTA